MRPDDREYLLRANSDWPWVLVPLMGMVFVLGVGGEGRMPVPGTALSSASPIEPPSASRRFAHQSHFAQGEEQ
jgi:hypothetical protein